MKAARGFTLIELIVVIVILGILAATALPKFVDLSGEAAGAGVKGVAGGITSAASVNYGTFMANSSKARNLGTQTNLCSSAAVNEIMQTPLDSTYAVAASGTANCTTMSAGESATCIVSTLAGSVTYSAQATMICAK